MTTIAEKLDSILNTKDAIRHVIEDNDGYVPDAFSEYPTSIDAMISDVFLLLLLNDTLVIRNDTKVTDLNRLISKLPQSGKTTTEGSKPTATIITDQINVRNSGSASGTYAGLLVKGDVVNVYGTASSGWYKINQWRSGASGALTNHGTTYGYISNNSSYVEYHPGSTSSTKKIIDISNTNGTAVQQKCNYVLAQSKGWEVKFADAYKPGSGGNTSAPTTERTTTFAFNNYFTDQYKNSTYTSFSNSMSNEMRQGYWAGYYYYKGNFRFTSARLSELKSVLNNSTVKSVQIYVQRTSRTHGVATGANLKLYACDSTGAHADVLVNGTDTLTRGAGVWTTLPANVVNGLKNGTYDHFKAYHPSTAKEYYIVFDLNAQLKVTYTA